MCTLTSTPAAPDQDQWLERFLREHLPPAEAGDALSRVIVTPEPDPTADEVWLFVGLGNEPAHVEGAEVNLVLRAHDAFTFTADFRAVRRFAPTVLTSDFSARFLTALQAVKQEIEERVPGYFEYHALRLSAPPGAVVNLVPDAVAAEMMLSAAARPRTIGAQYHVAAATDVPFAELCEQIGIAYDVSLLPVGDRDELNAIDDLFEQRLSGYAKEITTPREGEGAALLAEVSAFDEPARGAWLETVAGEQDAARRRRDERVARLPGSLQPHAVETEDRGDLVYYAIGTGDVPLVLINALGQGLAYWLRLIDILSRTHRVVIWESRGTHSAQSQFGLSHQVADLEAILDHEGARACSLVGWCTGGKVAAEFLRRHPTRVTATIFLNATFKWEGGAGELDSEYERSLEPVCRAIGRTPALAISMRELIGVGPTEAPGDLERGSPSEAVAQEVLQMINRDLAAHVGAPFRTEESTVNYARQSLDFWSHDATTVLEESEVPMLMVSCEHDTISSPAMARDLARLYPRVNHVEVRGATHYCLYDRAELVGELVQRFISDSSDLSSFESRTDLRVTSARTEAIV